VGLTPLPDESVGDCSEAPSTLFLLLSKLVGGGCLDSTVALEWPRGDGGADLDFVVPPPLCTTLLPAFDKLPGVLRDCLGKVSCITGRGFSIPCNSSNS